MDIVDELNAGEPANGEATPAAIEPTPAPEPQEAAEAVTPEAPETEAQAQQRERDEKGRFKPKADDQTMVPLTALHETRDKVRALEAELEKLRPARQEQQPQQVPDIFEDPQGFTGHIANTVQQAVLNTTLNMSEVMTRKSAGGEVVDQAQQWGTQAFAQNPALYQQFIAQPDPYGFLVEQYQKATALQKLGDDPSQIEAFLQWREAQNAPQPAPTAPAIPTSLASEQSSRGGAAPYQPPSLDDILKG